jgi:hypothetical protein
MRFLTASLLSLLLLIAGPAVAQNFGQNYDIPLQSGLAPVITLTGVGAGTFNSSDLPNSGGNGVILGINISAKTGTIAVTVAIQGKDIASGQYYSICTSASLTSAAFSTLSTYPAQTTQANIACAVPLPATWRVQVVSSVGASPVITMTVGASVLK